MTEEVKENKIDIKQLMNLSDINQLIKNIEVLINSTTCHPPYSDITDMIGLMARWYKYRSKRGYSRSSEWERTNGLERVVFYLEDYRRLLRSLDRGLNRKHNLR